MTLFTIYLFLLQYIAFLDGSSVTITPTPTSMFPSMVSSIMLSVNGTWNATSSNDTTLNNTSINNTSINATMSSKFPMMSSSIYINQSLKCEDKDSWLPDVYLDNKDCLTDACATKMFDELELYIDCNGYVRTEEPQYIGGRVNDYSLLRGKELYDLETLSRSDGKVLMGMERKRDERKHFLIEYGFIQKSHIKSFEPLTFKYPNDVNILRFPPTELEEDVSAYHFSVFKDIYKTEYDVSYYPEDTALNAALKDLDIAEGLQEPVIYQLNSDLISFNLSPPKKILSDYVDITFVYRDHQKMKNHKCVVLQGQLGLGWWSDAGCHAYKTENRRINCRCSAVVGTFAVISEVDETIPPGAPLVRDSKTTIFLVVCLLGIFLMLLALLLPYIVGCSHIGGMIRIYRFADVTFILTCLVMIAGVYYSDVKSKVKLIAPTLHFLQHSNMMWAIIEGVHVFHGMTPLYSNGVTGMMFFYSTLAYGIPAGIAGSGAGYDMTFTGQLQYTYVHGRNADIIYFFIPTVLVIACLLTVDALLVHECMSWIGSKQDYLYARAMTFIKRSTGFMIVLVATHAFGIAAMSKGSFSTFFVGFLMIQAICLFYFHFISNYEVWEWKEKINLEKKLKEMEEMEELDSSDSETDDSDEESGAEEMEEKQEPGQIKTTPSPTGSAVPLIKSDNRPSTALSGVAFQNSAEESGSRPNTGLNKPSDSRPPTALSGTGFQNPGEESGSRPNSGLYIPSDSRPPTVLSTAPLDSPPQESGSRPSSRPDSATIDIPEEANTVDETPVDNNHNEDEEESLSSPDSKVSVRDEDAPLV